MAKPWTKEEMEEVKLAITRAEWGYETLKRALRGDNVIAEMLNEIFGKDAALHST